MKILWLCNLILPEIATDLGLPSIPKEGWVKGLFDAIHSDAKVDIALAFPVSKDTLKNVGGKEVVKQGIFSGSAQVESKEINYFAFYENTKAESEYNDILEAEMAEILAISKPDVVHIFGTEFPHALAMARVLNNPSKLLISLQGICTEIANRYTANLPLDIVARHTFRDWIKKDSIYEQQQKYEKRGVNEREALGLAGHIAGRTDFDKHFAMEVNPNAHYHYAGENLRKEFYSGSWNRETCEKYRIFVSQADYPLKGFHYLLIAVGEILAQDEGCDSQRDIQIYVAGQSIVNADSLKNKIKISSYGKYLRELIDKYNLQDRVHILGRLSAAEMKEQYLKCDTYVCCSSNENSPNSLGEAMMLQVPIVTSEVGGILSVFDKSLDGYSFANEYDETLDEVAEALKNALLCRWSDNPESIDEKRHRAGFHARENHNPEKNASDVLRIYESMV